MISAKKAVKRADFIRSILKRSYTHGETIQTKIRLYYQEGRHRRFVDIPQGMSPWYFYVKTEDFLKYENLFKGLHTDGMILKVRKHGEDYRAIYCKNRHLSKWDLEKGYEDAKTVIVRTLDSLEIPHFEADLSPLDRFLCDHNVKIEDEYYIGYFDIETDDRKNDFTPGCQRILSMAVTDCFGKKWYLTSKNEEKLLEKMVKLLRRFAIIVGYNSKKFDLPYIKARCDLYGIEFSTADMIHIDLWERLNDLYRFDKEGPSKFGLDDIAMHFLNEHKVKFSNDNGFYWNWLNNHDEFKEYNIRDTELLLRIDEHIEAIRMMVLQSKLCGIFLNRFYNTRLTDMYLLRLAKKNGMALPTKKEHFKIQMPGGRVHTPVPGLHNNVEVWDFSQMYSTIMRSFNISPETLVVLSRDEVNKIRSQDKHGLDCYHLSPIHHVVKLCFSKFRLAAEARELEVQVAQGDWTKIRISNCTDEAIKAIKCEVLSGIQESLTLKSLSILRYFIKTRTTPNEEGYSDIELTYEKQVFFKKAPRSLVAEMLQTFVDQRDTAKKGMAKHDEGTAEYKLAKAYNLAYKLMGNVVFGYMSSNLTRCYSHPIACSITLAGQTIINLVMRGTKKKFGVDTVYSDTDSVFLQLGDGVVLAVSNWREQYYEWFVKYLNGALKHYFNIDTHCMDIEPKILYDVLLLIKKKNYVGYSFPLDKWETMGMDYIKRNTIPLTKVLQEELVHGVILKPEFRKVVALRDWVQGHKDAFFEQKITPHTVKDFVIKTRVDKDPSEYKNDPIHARIVQKVRAAGGQFFTGGVLSYVIIESTDKKIQGEEIERFLANPNLKIDKKKYWSTHVFSKLKRVLDAIHPEVPWEAMNPTDEAKRQARIERFKKGIRDPKRREKSLGLMLNMKSLHKYDKKTIVEWAYEEGYIKEKPAL